LATHPSTNKRFPLRCRLADSSEFDSVFENNEARASSTSLLILAKPNNFGFNRLGMIVSKKSIPKSVNRSKVKRKIRETFRNVIFESILGWDIVVMTRTKINFQKDFARELEYSFTSLAEKLR
jgi:ribonuclease P protein component